MANNHNLEVTVLASEGEQFSAVFVYQQNVIEKQRFSKKKWHNLT